MYNIFLILCSVALFVVLGIVVAVATNLLERFLSKRDGAPDRKHMHKDWRSS
jgi:hypothetical protein